MKSYLIFFLVFHFIHFLLFHSLYSSLPDWFTHSFIQWLAAICCTPFLELWIHCWSNKQQYLLLCRFYVVIMSFTSTFMAFLQGFSFHWLFMDSLLEDLSYRTFLFRLFSHSFIPRLSKAFHRFHRHFSSLEFLLNILYTQRLLSSHIFLHNNIFSSSYFSPWWPFFTKFSEKVAFPHRIHQYRCLSS